MAKLLRAFAYFTAMFASEMRKVGIASRYPGVTFRGRVVLDRGVTISCAPNSRIVIEDSRLCRGVQVAADRGGRVSLAGCYVGPYSVVVAHESISIARETKIAEFVVIRDQDHDRRHPLAAHEYLTQPIVIAEHAWLGARVTILRGVTVGRDSTVGAGSVVTRSVAPGQVVVGAPAREVRSSGR